MGLVSVANQAGTAVETISNLKQVMVLAEMGNFRRAAEHLGISHSALSQSVAKLEKFYGVALFDRDRKGTVPNAFGRKVLDVARSVVSEISQVEREIHLMRNLEEGQLIVGASPAVLEGVLGPILSLYSRKHPNLSFTIRPQSIETFEDELRAHEIDVYIGMTPDRDRPGLKFEAIHTAPPVIVCRKSHPILCENSVLEHIHEYPTAGPEAPDWVLEGVWAGVMEGISEAQLPGASFLKTSNVGLLRHVVLNSDTIAFTTEWSMSGEIESGVMVAIARPPQNTNPGGIVILDGHPLSPLARKFIDEVCHSFDQRCAV